MGTTSTSGWGLFWFLTGFMVLFTPTVGAGAFGLIAGLVMIIYSGVLFQAAKKKEEA